MNKALIVLAACIDLRSGKRFDRGDIFLPEPSYDQAVRLIAAGCLPAEALEHATRAEADFEALAAERAALEASMGLARDLAGAKSAKESADQAVETARVELARAKGSDEKSSAEKALKKAEAAAKAASDRLTGLTG